MNDNPYDACGTCIHQIQHHDSIGCLLCDCTVPTGHR